MKAYTYYNVGRDQIIILLCDDDVELIVDNAVEIVLDDDDEDTNIIYIIQLFYIILYQNLFH